MAASRPRVTLWDLLSPLCLGSWLCGSLAAPPGVFSVEGQQPGHALKETWQRFPEGLGAQPLLWRLPSVQTPPPRE